MIKWVLSLVKTRYVLHKWKRWVTPGSEVAWLSAVSSVITEPLHVAASRASSHPHPAAAQQNVPRPRPRQTRDQLPGHPANSGLDTVRAQARFQIFTQAPDIYFEFLPSSFLHNPSQVAFDLHLLEVWSYLTKRIFIHLLLNYHTKIWKSLRPK